MREIEARAAEAARHRQATAEAAAQTGAGEIASQSAPEPLKNEPLEKGLDNAGEVATIAPQSDGGGFPGLRETMIEAARASWVWGSMEALSGVIACLPQDAPGNILPLCGALLEALKVADHNIDGDLLPIPELTPPSTYEEKGKPVENTTVFRPYWKPSALRALTTLMDAIDADAPNPVFDAYGALREAVSKARPGANPDTVTA